MYYPLGDLQTYIHKNRSLNSNDQLVMDIETEPIDINQLVDFAKQIAIGLNITIS